LTPVGYRALRDADITKLGSYLVHTYDFGSCSSTTSRHALHTEAEYHTFDEAKDWIDARPDWDGERCLDSWLITYGGADTRMHSTEYLALVGSKYVMQVLHRALNPGTKADYSLVFTGIQGTGKDRTLEAIFSPYYREGIPSPGRSPADFARGIAGAFVAHAAEMSAWRKSDVEEQKAALTRCVDTDRPAYGHEVRSYPRRTCLAFSTNDFEFLQDATGDRRYWPIATIQDRIDIEGLRRDRDQLLAEALHRLKEGELHWPTPEEEERFIVPERQKFRSEAALEIVAILERFITEEPQTPRPNRVDFTWKWLPRPQPLRELHLDEFFGQSLGMYAGLPRQGLTRASKRDTDCCITWLREKGWRRVDKCLPDGQRVRIWRAPDERPGPHLRRPKLFLGSALGSNSTSSDVAGSMTDAADAAGTVVSAAPTQTQEDGWVCASTPAKSLPVSNFSSKTPTQTQAYFPEKIPGENFKEEGDVKISPRILLRKVCLGLRTLDGLLPATLEGLEESFPRDRFLAIDVETVGLDAARDGLRTVQFCDGESVAIIVFDRPVQARALVVLADFLRRRRVVVHNARFEGSFFHEAGIGLVLDDTVLLFSAVRGTRSLHGGKLIGGGGGRVSLAMLAAMVLGETLDKSEQTSDWAAPILSPQQLTYALNDAIVTYRIFEALRAELHRKSKQHGVGIAAGYEDLRFSAALAHSMERAGIGFDVQAHAAWIARKQEPVAALEAHLATLDSRLSSQCIASGVQLDKLFRQRLEVYPDSEKRPVLLKWPKTEMTRRLSDRDNPSHPRKPGSSWYRWKAPRRRAARAGNSRHRRGHDHQEHGKSRGIPSRSGCSAGSDRYWCNAR
jgi:hypothetical protein